MITEPLRDEDTNLGMRIEVENMSPTREWFQGLIDLHCYTRPCVFARMFTTLGLARQCRDVGYRAIVIKNHFYPTVEGAYLASEEAPGIGVYGGVVLNWPVGGLNPHAVDTAILLGAKVIWMGNMHAGTLSKEPFRTRYGWGLMAPPNSVWVTRPAKEWMVAPPINVIDLDTGELLPVVKDIIDLIAEADIILATCHISKRECFAVVPAAMKAGVNRIVITHPDLAPVEDAEQYWTIDELKRITEMGATLEHVATMYNKNQTKFGRLVDAISAVGADRCVLASDSGSVSAIHPIENMRHFIWNLLQRGISEGEISTMTKKNPAKLLGLEC